MDEKQLQEIRERAEKATPGPWLADTVDPGDVVIWEAQVSADKEKFLGNVGDGRLYNALYEIDRLAVIFDMDAANAEFIAHARQDVPDLLDEVDNLRRQLEQARTSEETAKQLYKAYFEDVKVLTGRVRELKDQLESTLVALGRIRQMADEDMRTGKAEGTFLYQIEADARTALGISDAGKGGE